MKKLFITSAVAIAISVPAMADPVTPNIAVGTNPADCTEPVLGTTSGTSNLEANWTANTLYLQWYDDVDGNEIIPNNNAANTCTYDSGITVPSNTLTKTGYTFAGWQVKVAPSGFDLSTLDASINGSSYSYIKFDGTVSKKNKNTSSRAPSAHSITENGEWAAEFSYGTVKGIARCSLVGAGAARGDIGDPTDDFNRGRYCWCQATGFDANKDGDYESVGSSRWVFLQGIDKAANCVLNCTSACGVLVRDNAGFRSALFGLMQ